MAANPFSGLDLLATSVILVGDDLRIIHANLRPRICLRSV